MPIIRQPTAATAIGTNWANVLVDQLQYAANTYAEITIYCTNASNAIIDYQYVNTGTAGTAGNYRTPTVTFSGLSPGTTYYFYAQVKHVGTRVRVPDSGYLVVTTIPLSNPRPSNFSWTYTKTSSGSFNLYAFEWNNLFAKINEFRSYKNLGNYSYNTAYSGYDFYAYMFNQAVSAISTMSPSNSPPSTVASGGTVYAYQLNQLVTSLNSIT